MRETDVTRLTALFGVIAVLALAACGDDGGSGGSEDPGDEFVTEQNALCEEGTQETIDNNLELGYSPDPKDHIELGQRVVESREEITAQIEELEPPEEDAEAFDEMVAARKDLIALAEDRVDAVRKDDQEALDANTKATEEASDLEDAASAELGAEMCDGDLPEEDAQAAEDTLREFATTADPATSCNSDTGLVTEPYLEEGFGGVEACEKEQQKLEDNPKDLAEDLDVTETTGVDGMAATIEYADVGGLYDGQPSLATIYNLEGGWKIYSISLAE